MNIAEPFWKASKLISDYQPRPAIATVYPKLWDDLKLAAAGTIEGINVASVRVIPEVIFYEDLDPYSFLWHQYDYNTGRRAGK